MAFTIGRFGPAGRALRPRSGGSKGRMRVHCALLSSCRPLTAAMEHAMADMEKLSATMKTRPSTSEPCAGFHDLKSSR